MSNLGYYEPDGTIAIVPETDLFGNAIGEHYEIGALSTVCFVVLPPDYLEHLDYAEAMALASEAAGSEAPVEKPAGKKKTSKKS